MIMPMIIMLRKGKQGVSAFELTTNAENNKTLRIMRILKTLTMRTITTLVTFEMAAMYFTEP